VFMKGPALVKLEKSDQHPDSYLGSNRHDTLTKTKQKFTAISTALKKCLRSGEPWPSQHSCWRVILLLGPFELGPAAAFYSFNPVEGFKLRLGGRTTPKLSKRLYFETYGAYGFKDERWKYFLSSTYSLNNKSIYEYPLNFIRVGYQHDTKIPGQELQFVAEDNFLIVFQKR
jgi:hypothetical protein